MFKIKIFCPFAPSKNCKEIYERINYSEEIVFYGKDKKYIFTENDDYTHAIIINTIMPKLSIPKENVIGLAFEPIYFLGLNNTFIEYAKKNIGKYFIGDKNNLPEPFIEHFGYMWHSRPPKEIQIKQKLMSIIVSEKLSAPGHKYRHELVKSIIDNNLPIDIYGRGSNNYLIQNQNKEENKKNSQIMGGFNDAEPYENYMFSICIENYKCGHYFSEKIITPLMFNCMPIYYGCLNIDSYVENKLILTGNIGEDLMLIKNVLQNPSTYYKKTYTEKNIKAVNLIQNLPNLFSVS
jgi:hypothetical protein